MIRFLIIATLLGAGLYARSAWAQPDCNDWNSVSFFENATAADVRRCLAAGAEVNVRAEHGLTPLHLAADYGDAGMIAALVKAGANIELRAELGVTPLHAAAVVGNAETVAALVRAGANIRTKTTSGKLPADLAEDNDKVKNHDIFWTLNAVRYE
ncbi:MAG: ankyrin repeat domain-containing protein [Hyphomonadaceae bacterium]|nr:ankyrin repeat domain-containing protein [Hyphomonadaceae bacterium]